VSRIVNKIKKPKSTSYQLYDYLMNATNARVVLLTGTPIINYPNEIGILYNILRGYIKTWSMTINVKTTDKINTDTILDMFDKENFKTYDYVEYRGNKLTISRNPFGFVNNKKRGVAKGTIRKKDKDVKVGGFFDNILGVKNKTKKIREPIKIEPIHILNATITGGGDVFDKYDGVHFDETGNVSDSEFQNTITRILTKNKLEIQAGSVELKKNKALPDDSLAFLEMFVNTDNGDVKNIDLFQRRILGLTSYFRSAQEQLLPRLIKNEDGDIFHIIKTEMTTYQFGIYEKIRKEEAEQEKKNKKNQKKMKGKPDEDLYKISSTYRIFSRSACNFTFPAGIDRPLPDKISMEEIDEKTFNAIPLDEAEDEAEDEEEEEGKTGEVQGKPSVADTLNYQKRIEAALENLKYNEESPREIEYLTKENLMTYSPKFVKVLENIQSEENQGLHLLYSQFRTIEGIGILKLILEANGYAEFKINKVGDVWQIVEDPKDAGKPRFVLYTGTESTEEKEIVRNVYNSSWEFVPSTIAVRLREQSANNFYGEIIKVFMITSSGAEGINLKNTRFVHIVEPYWHMVRTEQVIGRARRICSHKDLPSELRTVKVFMYLSTLSEEQKTSEKNVELRIRDVSKLDGKTPVTTDEMLFETATLKDRINRQILKAVKESAMDCALYSTKNKDEPLVCYGYGKIESNQFGSYPSFDQDRSEKKDLNLKQKLWTARKITYLGNDYALNEGTNELFDYESYRQSVETGADLISVGQLIKTEKGYKVELI